LVEGKIAAEGRKGSRIIITIIQRRSNKRKQIKKEKTNKKRASRWQYVMHFLLPSASPLLTLGTHPCTV
jgi:hypothetical protein